MDGWHAGPEEAMHADGATFTDYRPPPGRFQAKTLAECRVDHAADYLIKGVLARRDLALIYGQPGAGKGLLGPLLAHATAKGRRVFGRRTRASRVLYIAAEAPGDMETRFVALRQRYGEAADLHLLAGPMDLHSPDSADLTELRTYIARLKPDLILLDTLAAAFPGLEENESRDMGRAAKKLRLLGTPIAEPEITGGWTGAAVVAIHHAPKNGDTPRGHGNLNADADVTMRVEGQDDQPRSVTFGKNRNGPSGHAFDFAVELVELGTDADGDPIRRPIAVEVETDPAAKRRGKPLPDKQAAALRDILDMLATPGAAVMRAPIGAGPQELTLTRVQVREGFRVRGRFEAEPHAPLTDRDRRNFTDWLNALETRREICMRDGLIWRHPSRVRSREVA